LAPRSLPAYPGPSQPPGAYRLAPALRDRIDGWRVAVVDDAINAGTAVGVIIRPGPEHTNVVSTTTAAGSRSLIMTWVQPGRQSRHDHELAGE
jgi:hypothetical protein